MRDGELRPAPKPQVERPPAEDRKTRLTNKERAGVAPV